MEVDDKAWRLISALQADGRASLKELAEAVGLSVPATLERLRRLQEAGVVRGVHADIDPAKVGYGVRAVVGINVPQPGKKALIDKLRQSPQVLECHHVSGNDSYVMQVVARDLPDLERFLGDINGYGETRTSIGSPRPSSCVDWPARRRADPHVQNVIFTDAALRCASPWNTASMLLPSGSSTNAA